MGEEGKRYEAASAYYYPTLGLPATYPRQKARYGGEMEGHACDAEAQRTLFDHIISYSRGGDYSVDNLQVLCRSCNPY